MFQKLSIVAGVSPGDNLLNLITHYNGEYQTDFEIISEPDLIKLFNHTDIGVTRQTLHKWRNGNVIKLDEHWFTDGRSIIYNKDAMLFFVNSRKSITEII